MLHAKQLIIASVLIVLAGAQTGCGRFSNPAPTAVAATTPTAMAGIGNSTSTPTASVTDETPPAPPNPGEATGNQTSSAASPTPSPYPSFGLDVSGAEVLALNERLAELGYLPVSIAADTEPTITLANLDSPPQVSFTWKYDNVPADLAAQWSPETYTQMTRAAVIAVEHVNGLPIDGIVGEMVWKAILGPNAVANPNPYTYVLVTKNPAPEMLRIWQAGKWVYQSVANTGVSEAPSTNGTFAVYQRFLSQTMKGKNPDGTKYSDPGVPYVNYYDGSEAIHGFPRATYGSPQSVGCVELPIDHAKVVWSLIDYGTLVTVEGKYVAPGSAPSANNGQSGGSTTTPPLSGGQGSGSNTTTPPRGRGSGANTPPSTRGTVYGNATSSEGGTAMGHAATNNTNTTSRQS